MKRTATVSIVCLLMFAGVIQADQFTTAFPDPSKPGIVYIPNGNGDVFVTGYNGREVIIESNSDEFNSNGRNNSRAQGLRRLAGNSTRVDTNPSDNSVRVTRSFTTNEDITVKVPYNSSVFVGNGLINGDIEVSGVTGKVNVKTMGGKIVLTNISSEVNAITMGGNIEILIDRIVNTDNNMIINTMGGNIDMTIPADVKADVYFRTLSGDMYTDFDIQRDASVAMRASDRDLEFEWETETEFEVEGLDRILRTPRVPRFNFGGVNLPSTTFAGKINGGGRYISLETMGGNIYFRKK